jgi:hypothetical protein
MDEPDLLRFRALLKASWASFGKAFQSSEGLELRKGLPEGGRD